MAFRGSRVAGTLPAVPVQLCSPGKPRGVANTRLLFQPNPALFPWEAEGSGQHPPVVPTRPSSVPLGSRGEWPAPACYCYPGPALFPRKLRGVAGTRLLLLSWPSFVSQEAKESSLALACYCYPSPALFPRKLRGVAGTHLLSQPSSVSLGSRRKWPAPTCYPGPALFPGKPRGVAGTCLLSQPSSVPWEAEGRCRLQAAGAGWLMTE